MRAGILAEPAEKADVVMYLDGAGIGLEAHMHVEGQRLRAVEVAGVQPEINNLTIEKLLLENILLY